MADAGLFTPASVTWQMHGDPMMWVAGIRALYLQALHPRAVRGVLQNSDFRKDAWGRLMRTADFVGTTTYGTTEAAERAGARVRKIHSMLSGLDPDAVPANQQEMNAYFEKVRPELAVGPEAREVDDFLLRPPTHPLLAPAREVLWRRVAHLAYAALPPYAHELYGRPAPAPASV